jgi:hypothetical protein
MADHYLVSSLHLAGVVSLCSLWFSVSHCEAGLLPLSCCSVIQFTKSCGGYSSVLSRFSLCAFITALSASSFPGIPSSVILSPSCPRSFLIVRVFGFFVSFLSEAATSVLKESVAMSFLSGSLIVEWMAVIIADCSALKIVFCGRTLF